MSPSNVTYNRKEHNNYTGFMFSPKSTNRILSILHFANPVIIMSRTDGILIVMSYLPDYVAVHSYTANAALHTINNTLHKKNSKYFPLSEVIFYLLLNIN